MSRELWIAVHVKESGQNPVQGQENFAFFIIPAVMVVVIARHASCIADDAQNPRSLVHRHEAKAERLPLVPDARCPSALGCY